MGTVTITPGKPLPKGQESQYELSRKGKKLSGSSYPNVVAARNESLIRGAASNNLSTSQEEELRSKGISVTPDTSSKGVVVTQVSPTNYSSPEQLSESVSVRSQDAPTYKNVVEERNRMIVERNRELAQQESTGSNESDADRINREFKSAGVNNAEDFFGKVKSGDIKEENGQYLITTRKEEKSVDDVSSSQELRLESKPKEKSKLIKAYEASPLYGFFEGIKFAFNKPPEYQYSDISGEQEKLSNQDVGRQGFANTLLIGGLGMTARPLTMGGGKFSVKSEVSVVQRETPGVISSEAKVVSVVERPRSFLGVTLKPKVFGVVGTVRETATDSGFVGLESGKPVYGTVGESKFLVKNVKSGKVSLFETDSVGNEVGGVGQRQTVASSSLAVPSGEGVVGVRQVGVDKFTESYVGVKKNDNIVYGGVVSKRGGGVYVGEKFVQSSFVEPGVYEYYNPELGISSMTPTLYLRQGSVPVTVKVYDVLSAGQSELGGGALSFRGNVRNRLLVEKSVYGLGDDAFARGSVGGVAREQVTTQELGGVVGRVSVFDVDNLVGKAVSSTESRVVSPVPVVASSGVVSVNVPARSDFSKSVGDGFVESFVDVVPSGQRVVGVVKSDYGFRNVVKQSPIVEFKVSQFQGGVSDLKLGQVQSPVQSGIQSSVQSQFQSQVQSPVQSSVQSSVQSQVQSQVSDLKLSQVQSSIQSSRFTNFGFNSPPIISSGFKSVPAFRLGAVKDKGLFSVEVRRRGKFQVVASGVPLAKAYSIGKSEVGNSAAASFRVVAVNQKGLGELESGFSLGRGLYKSKKEAGVIIEKPSYRIKSSGEVSEISLKGVAANRKKKKVGVFVL